jgi:hypothetical protein
MVVFEFNQPVPDGYTAQIGGKLYLPTLDPNYPTRLFFIGVELPLQIPASITLISEAGATSEVYQSYYLPDCRALAEPVQIPVATLTAIPYCPEGEFYNPIMDRCWPIREPQPAQPPSHQGPSAYQPPIEGTGPEPTATLPSEETPTDVTDPTPTEPTPTDGTPGEGTEPTPTEGTENPDVG